MALDFKLSKFFIKGSIKNFLLILFASLVTSYFHLVESEISHIVHVFHYYFFFLIVIYSAYSFGFLGGVLCSLFLSVGYVAKFAGHLGHDFQYLIEAALILTVGIFTGFSSQKLYLEKAKFMDVSLELSKTLDVVKKRSEELLLLEREVARTDRLRMLGQLIAGVAHEIRNPLAAIKSGVLMLKKGKQSEEILNIITKEIDRLNDIIERFLQYAKVSKGRNDNIDISSFLEELVEMAKLYLKEKDGIVFSTSFNTDKDYFIKGDVNHLKQAFLNIILNAFDAVADLNGEGKVSLSAECSEGYVNFTIKDNGKGITKDVLDKIFDPFFTTKNTGTGLGLSIAAKIIEEHDGTISVKTGLETEFIITLKAYKDEDIAH